MLMRCTRCDGLAVPQAVGIDPQGKVIFGWCLQCLADRGCTLVETSPIGGPSSISPVGRSHASDAPKVNLPGGAGARALEFEQAGWVVGIVASLMMSWGLILVAAGLCGAPTPDPDGSPLGNGTPALLTGGGAATALAGLGLMVLASRRGWSPGTFLPGLVSWLSFLLGLGILAHAIVVHHPRRQVGLVVGVALCQGISVLMRVIQRAEGRKSSPRGHAAASMLGAGDGKPRAADWRSLL